MKADAAAIALCVVVLGGCTASPRVTAISRGSPVAFEVVKGQPARAPEAVRDKSVHSDSVEGLTSGALAGAASGLACGPLLWVCSPIMAMMGAGVGGAMGLAVGLADSLPKDQVLRLEERLVRLQQSVDPVVELRDDVLDRAGKHWVLTHDTSAGVVTLEVQELFLTSDGDRNIALVLQVLVKQRTGEDTVRPKSAAPARYVVVSQGSSLAAWLDERSDLPEVQLRSACEQLAAQIVSELAFN